MVDLYQALLRLRREDAVLRDQDRQCTSAEALGQDALLVRRWRGAEQRVLVANFGDSPVQAPPGSEWVLLSTSPTQGTLVPGRCAVMFAGGRA
jgi:hypothetical protein